MKKILFVAFAATLMAAGCQKTEIINPVGNSIGFTTEMGKLTKAQNPDEVGLATLKDYGFRVWVYRNYEDAYYAGADVATNPTGVNAIYDGMSALEVSFDETSSKWATGKAYYWPGTGKGLKFYAVSCNETDYNLATENNVVIAHDPATSTETGTITVNGFEVKEDANNDLMIADAISQAQADAENGNTVKPIFRHTLTKVQFNFKTDASTMAEHPVYIQSIVTSDLKTKGSITLPMASDATTPWTLQDATAEFKDDNETPIVLPTKENSTDEIEVDGEVPATDGSVDRTGLTLTDDFVELDTWLLLPQELNASGSEATVTVTYIIKDRQFTRTFPLYTSGLTKWEANQFVKYNVTLAPNLISFEPSVEDWVEKDMTMNDNGTSVTPDNGTDEGGEDEGGEDEGGEDEGGETPVE